jgi:YD repeat-containing protein
MNRICPFFFFLTFLLLAGYFQVNAQNEDDNTKEPRVIPPSPDASSLGKFGDIPIGKYTGIPQISIPIYTISQHDIQLPVSLSYHAGGIKVEEMSGWTGLGWALNAGGVITRSVVGLADERPSAGYLNQPYDIENISSLSSVDQHTVLTGINNHTLDTEPDLYNFNFQGFSGKFIIDKSTKTGIASPKQNLKIYMPGSTGHTTWEIDDDKGFKYIFGTVEVTRIESAGGGGRNSSFFQVYASSWYLTSIISPTGNTLTINYQDYTNDYYTRGGSSKYVFLAGGIDGATNCSQSNEAETYSENTISGKRVESIDFDNGKVKFVKSSALRSDMPDDYYLDAIEVYDLNNTLVKSYKLSYSYFDSDAHPNSHATGSYTDYRLRLDKLEETTSPGLSKPYQFQYISGTLPSVFSNSQDHWGFYNGKDNSSLIPLDFTTGIGGGGVDRSVDFNQSKIGTLSKIIYPTGGSTTFEYESNEALITSADYQSFFYPYGPTSSQYLHLYSAAISSSNRTASIYVDPQTIAIDQFNNNFNFHVKFADGRDCDGGDRDCVGSIELTIVCSDCGFSDGTGPGYSLLAGDYVNGNNLGKIRLIPGKTYELSMTGPAPQLVGLTATVTGTKEILPTPNSEKSNMQVGGLRVKSVSNDGGTGNPIVKTSYLYTDNLAVDPTSTIAYESSGTLVNFPIYENINSYIRTDQSGPSLAIYNCYFRVRSSASKLPLTGSGGGTVGYSHVQTYQDDGVQKIRSVSVYSSPKDFPDVIAYTYPSAITLSNENFRGSLIEEQNYRYTGSQYVLINKTTNTYFSSLLNTSYSYGARFGITVYVDPSILVTGNEFIIREYKIPAEWRFLQSTTKTTYDEEGLNPISETITNSYDNLAHMQITKSEQIVSNGSKIITQYVYPQDYAAGNAVIDELISKNIVGRPIEIVKYRSDGGSNRIISGTVFTFKSGGTGLVDEVFSMESGSPIPQAEFKFSNKLLGDLPFSGSTATDFFPDAHYKSRLKYYAYDIHGNVLDVGRSNDLHNCYLWGYHGSYPVAQVKGTTYASISSLIDQSILDNPTSDLQLRQEVDKVRTSLASTSAEVMTYSYNPMLGLTSQTDANGRSQFFEYDALGRLWLIRDNEGKIIKKLCYNYAGQVGSCQ